MSTGADEAKIAHRIQFQRDVRKGLKLIDDMIVEWEADAAVVGPGQKKKLTQLRQLRAQRAKLAKFLDYR